MEERKITGLAAIDMLASLAKEKEFIVAAAKDSGLSPRAFTVYWILKNDPDLRTTALDIAPAVRITSGTLSQCRYQ